MYDAKYSLNSHINSSIDSYILSGSDNYSDIYIYSYILKAKIVLKARVS